MNGKKAKMLRSLAGPIKDTQYTAMKGTERNKFMNVSPKLNINGKQEVNDEGELQWNKVYWKTKTIMVGAGTRMLNKVLKNIYYNRTRDLHINIHTPVGA